MGTRRFTRRKTGELMTTVRVPYHIGFGELLVAAYRALLPSDGKLPTSRKAALQLAVRYVVTYGEAAHFEDFEEDNGERRLAFDRICTLFPELEGHDPE